MLPACETVLWCAATSARRLPNPHRCLPSATHPRSPISRVFKVVWAAWKARRAARAGLAPADSADSATDPLLANGHGSGGGGLYGGAAANGGADGLGGLGGLGGMGRRTASLQWLDAAAESRVAGAWGGGRRSSRLPGAGRRAGRGSMERW